ncbi:hypothetical protein [Variovorax sp. RHLX14]|uniref:hypothetical protein n=1 Tax=Variovorax sp. RHLX14 TaxID=1259731 RepID=UPI003F498F0E
MNSIDLGNAFVPSNFNYPNFLTDFSICQEQCNYASNFLKNPERELVCALTDTKRPNGYVLACENFDVVLLTIGFFIELDEVGARVFNVFFNGDRSEIIGPENFKSDFSSYSKEDQNDRNFSLMALVRHLAIGHIIGHEFGHLAAGHLGFANETKKYENDNGSLASNFFDFDSNDLISQAREIEADIYAANWIDSLLNRPVSPSHTEILVWLKNDPCRISFIFTLSSLLWYVTLGAEKFSARNFVFLTTHPPTGLRAKMITDSALVRNIQKDLINKHKHETFSLEAFCLIGLGEAFKRIAYLSDKPDEDSKKMFGKLQGLSKKDNVQKYLGEMGLSISDNRHQTMLTGDYFAKLWEIYIAHKSYNDLLSRWKPEARITWGNLKPQDFNF